MMIPSGKRRASHKAKVDDVSRFGLGWEAKRHAAFLLFVRIAGVQKRRHHYALPGRARWQLQYGVAVGVLATQCHVASGLPPPPDQVATCTKARLK